MVTSKVYLNVAYAEKEAAKALGAKWDPAKKKWFVPAGADINPFSKWKTDLISPSSSEKKATKGSSTKTATSGVTTFPKDKDFLAYSEDQPPWE